MLMFPSCHLFDHLQFALIHGPIIPGSYAILLFTASNLASITSQIITHIEPDILECEVKWALESITTDKASGGDGIPVELFQILKDDAMKVLHSICQHIWKTQQ